MLDRLLDLFNLQVATAFGVPVTLIEVVGFVTGAVCVYGVTRQSVWNWPVGLANNAAFAVLFFGAGLYAETALQGIFAVIALYGWWTWVHGGPTRNDLPVRRATRTEVVVLTVAGVAGTAAVAALLQRGTDSTVPFWDSLVLALSLVATYGQAKKLVSSWYVWIAVDLVAVPLYVTRDLLLTALLYVGFLCLCVLGAVRWHQALRTQGGARPRSQADLATVA